MRTGLIMYGRMAILVAAVLFAVLILHHSPTEASWLTWYAEQRLTGADRESGFPFCCTDGEGRLHIIWSDRRDGNYEIYYKVRDPGALAGVDDGHISQAETVLLSIAPNPVMGRAKICFALERPADISVSIYDTAGRLVWRASREDLAPGRHSIRWDRHDASGRPVAPGVYFAAIQTGTQEASAKVVILR